VKTPNRTEFAETLITSGDLSKDLRCKQSTEAKSVFDISLIAITELSRHIPAQLEKE
jgi:hypothetical protein